MDNSMKARIIEQTKAKDAIRESGYNCGVIATVGFGKGKVMIDIANELIEKFNIKTILYVCDSTRLRDSVKDGFPGEVEKWGSPRLKQIIELECYQTTRKWENKTYDLLLADEADFGLTPSYSNLFFRNKFKYKVFVTGTLAPSKRKMLLELVPISYKLTTVQAEEKGIVNKTNYYAYNFRLTDEESKEYVRLTRTIASKMAEDNETAARYFVAQRRELLFKAQSSYNHTRRVMKWVWQQNHKNRCVIFCQRTDQADLVCKWSYHGKNEKDDNLAKFQAGLISAISVVSKIKRGINLKNANVAIFKDLDGSTTEFEQRGGRMKRLPLSQIADIIFMIPWVKMYDSKGFPYYKETIVADWMHKATSNLGNINFIDLKI
jgi:superfamily II DNA or RNA helicase